MSTRAKYNAFLGAIETIMQNGGAAPSYDRALGLAMQRYPVPVQQMSNSLYDIYARYGKPASRYVVPQKTYAQGGGRQPARQASGGSSKPAQSAQARQAYQKTVAAIMRKKSAQILQYEDMISDILKKQKELGRQKAEGLQANDSYFSRISPDAYQSQIGTYNKKVIDAYGEGMATLNRNKTRVNQAKSNFIADINDALWNAAKGGSVNVTPQVVANAPLQASPLNVSAYTAPVIQAAGPNMNKGVPVNPWEFLK